MAKSKGKRKATAKASHKPAVESMAATQVAQSSSPTPLLRTERIDPCPLYPASTKPPPPDPAKAPDHPDQTIGCHHYWEDPLLDFARAAALLIDPQFQPPGTAFNEDIESDPFEGTKETKQIGSAAQNFSFHSELRWAGMGEPPEFEQVEIKTFGLSHAAELSVSFEIWENSSPRLELKIAAPPDAAEKVVQLFQSTFLPPKHHRKTPTELRGWVTDLFDAINRSNWQDARARAEKILAEIPDHNEAQLGLGIALAAVGKPAESHAILDPLCVRWPINPDAWYNLGNDLASLGRFAEAAAACEWGILLSPFNHPLHCQHGVSLENLGLRQPGIAAYVTALRTGPSSPLHWQGINREHTALDGLERLSRPATDDTSAAEKTARASFAAARNQFQTRIAAALAPAILSSALDRLLRFLKKEQLDLAPLLHSALDSSDPLTRTRAQVAVLAADDAIAKDAVVGEPLFELFRPALASPDPAIAKAARKTLDTLGVYRPDLPTTLPNLAEYLIKESKIFILRAVTQAGLIDGDWSKLLTGMDLAQSTPPSAGPAPLAHLPTTLQPHVRALQSIVIPNKLAAITALGASKNPAAVPPLLHHFPLEREELRKAIAQSLAVLLRSLGISPSSAPPMTPVLQALDEGPCHEGFVLSALAESGAPALPILLALMEDSTLHENYQQEIVRALAKFHSPRCANALALALTRGGDVFHAAARGLGQLADTRAVAPLVLMARESRSYPEEVELLQKILEKSAPAISDTNLQLLATLDGLEHDIYEVVSENPMFDSHEFVGTESVDTSAIQRLAKQELTRRAAPAPSTRPPA